MADLGAVPASPGSIATRPGMPSGVLPIRSVFGRFFARAPGHAAGLSNGHLGRHTASHTAGFHNPRRLFPALPAPRRGEVGKARRPAPVGCRVSAPFVHHRAGLPSTARLARERERCLVDDLHWVLPIQGGDRSTGFGPSHAEAHALQSGNGTRRQAACGDPVR